MTTTETIDYFKIVLPIIADMLDRGMQKKMEKDGLTYGGLADCYLGRGGVFSDPSLLPHGRFAMYCYAERGQVDYALAVDVPLPEGKFLTRDDLRMAEDWFKNRYKR